MQGTPSPNIFSVFGRFGAITAQSGDYTFAQIGSTPTTLSGYGITDAQALDADLTALAGLSTTGTIERTGDGTASTYTVTAAAKTVLDDADVAAMRTTLGIDPDYYKKSNILGTVTQSGGVPTGAVIEYGSNANGSYIKYADGTMLCWVKSSTVSTTSLLWASPIYAASGVTLNFPATFASTPVVAGGSQFASGTDIAWILFGGLTTTSVVLAAASTVQVGTILQALVIGRWY